MALARPRRMIEERDGYAVSRSVRRRIFVALALAHLAALWLALQMHDGAGHSAAPPGGHGVLMFDVEGAQPAPVELHRAGAADGTQALSPTTEPAQAAKSSGDPAARDAYGMSGNDTALSRALAEALADDPGAAGDRLAYRSRLIEHIRRFVFYPDEGLKEQLSGIVTVRFRIGNTGDVVDMRIVRSRGPVLDTAAMAAIWKAEPMPALPASIAPPWEVDVPVDFTGQLRRRS